MNECTSLRPCHQPTCVFCDPAGWLAAEKEPAQIVQEPPEGPAQGLGYLETLRAALVDTGGLDGIASPEPLVGDDVLFLDCLAWMVGKPGCGKSFVGLDLAGCVGTGEVWQGYRVRQGKVLYLVAEGVRGVKKRVRAWEQAMGRRMDGVLFLPVAVQAKHAGQWDAFVQLAADEQPALIVIDTQARVTVGMEENSNTEMGFFVQQAERLRAATGACVLIVHHIGRTGDTGRGATTLDGALSTVIKVNKDADQVTLECQKNKDGEQWSDIRLRTAPMGESLVLMLDAGGRVSVNRPWVRDWWEMFGDDPMTPNKLVDTLGVAKTTFYRGVADMAKLGLVAKEGRGISTRYALLRAPGST